MEKVIAHNGIVYYRSEFIPCTHGFSTRIGGVSTLDHTKGLNLCYGLGDDDGTVKENLSLFADAVGYDPRTLISVGQIHSDRVRYVTEKNAGEGVYKDAQESCDGYISDSTGVTLGVKTADCVPVLIYAPPKGDFRGAVMAVHAGWRGSAKGIVSVAVRRAVSIGADVKTMRAAIGPAISCCCYSVKDDFYLQFSEAAGRALADEFVKPDSTSAGVYRADLKGFNRRILMDCGLLSENIDVSSECTCCDPESFYSHRFSKGKRGSMLSVIAL